MIGRDKEDAWISARGILVDEMPSNVRGNSGV